MKYLLTVGFLMAVFFSSSAQRGNNPRIYYHQFSRELNIFRYKSMDYFEANLTDGDGRMLEAHLEAVNSQLRESRKRIERTPPFHDDAVLKEQYLAGIDSLIIIFQNEFAVIQHLKRYRNESYENLFKYYEALSKAEERVKKAESHLLVAEETFSRQNSLAEQRDSQDEQRYQRFMRINEHSRAISLCFYKIDQQVEQFFTTVKENPNQNLDTFALESRVEKLQDDVEKMLDEVDGLHPYDLDPILQKDMTVFLKKIKKDLRKSLAKTAKTLANEPYYSNDWRDARIDMRFFEQDYIVLRQKFLESRMTWLKGAFEDLQK